MKYDALPYQLVLVDGELMVTLQAWCNARKVEANHMNYILTRHKNNLPCYINPDKSLPGGIAKPIWLTEGLARLADAGLAYLKTKGLTMREKAGSGPSEAKRRFAEYLYAHEQDAWNGKLVRQRPVRERRGKKRTPYFPPFPLQNKSIDDGAHDLALTNVNGHVVMDAKIRTSFLGYLRSSREAYGRGDRMSRKTVILEKEMTTEFVETGTITTKRFLTVLNQDEARG